MAAACLADAAGLGFPLPVVARWHGCGWREFRNTGLGNRPVGRDGLRLRYHSYALVGRIFAARRMVNADHAGKCRFGFKIASGRNVGKHGRFGSDKGERNERDAYGESCQRSSNGYGRRKGIRLHGEGISSERGGERSQTVVQRPSATASAENSPVGRNLEGLRPELARPEGSACRRGIRGNLLRRPPERKPGSIVAASSTKTATGLASSAAARSGQGEGFSLPGAGARRRTDGGGDRHVSDHRRPRRCHRRPQTHLAG